MAPLVPYIELPELPILSEHFFGDFPSEPITFKPFGMLFALGAYTGTVAALRQARRLGASDNAVLSMTGWVAVSSFLFAHVFDALLYYPRDVLADPTLLLRFWEGLSSFGGFAGAFIGAFSWRRYYKARLLPYADIVASSFPVTWTFGRFGCTVAHDHPGIRSEFFLAVQYPDGGRHDLGFYEFLITVPLAIAFLALRRKPRPWGFYGGILCTYYAPLRFFFDFLREREDAFASGSFASGDARYVGLTPAQWACLPLLAIGITLLVRTKTAGSEVPPIPAAFVPKKKSSTVEDEGSGGDARDEG